MKPSSGFENSVIRIGSMALLFVSLSAFAADNGSPQEWLERMAVAAERMNYDGTVLRLREGEVETLRVTRQVKNDVVTEKVLSLDGQGLEIIRNGREVQCIIADKKSVLLEHWNDKSTIFSMLPTSDMKIGNEYDLAFVRKDRIAGRRATLLAIRPHDQFRYGYRLWLDDESAFPLKTELLDIDGATIEQVMFADINLDAELLDTALLPSVDIHGFTTYEVPSVNSTKIETDSDWSCTDLPPGFHVVSTETEVLKGADHPVLHIVFSDGLASVSVFIAEKIDESMAQRSNVGRSHSFTVDDNDVQITAIGEVPAATVERIAQSMKRQ